jgi:hypothetical protein
MLAMTAFMYRDHHGVNEGIHFTFLPHVEERAVLRVGAEEQSFASRWLGGTPLAPRSGYRQAFDAQGLSMVLSHIQQLEMERRRFSAHSTDAGGQSLKSDYEYPDDRAANPTPARVSGGGDSIPIDNLGDAAGSSLISYALAQEGTHELSSWLGDTPSPPPRAGSLS